MSTITRINEVDRETQKGFATGGQTSVETAGPLACLPEAIFMSDDAYDEFSASNPFAHGYVDYSNYAQAPKAGNSETTYSVAMANMLSMGSGFEGGDVCGDFSGGFDGGFAGGDCGCSCGGGDSFSASC
ncbi:hypothetical protein J6S88_00610 [bacterium]|nr:hypothetical protein [bacterium]